MRTCPAFRGRTGSGRRTSPVRVLAQPTRLSLSRPGSSLRSTYRGHRVLGSRGYSRGSADQRHSVLTSNDHSRLSTATVPASTIREGLNVIQVKATNADNPAYCGSDRYQCNPAGMVFGAKIKDALPAWPTCKPDETVRYSSGQPRLPLVPPDNRVQRICAHASPAISPLGSPSRMLRDNAPAMGEAITSAKPNRSLLPVDDWFRVSTMRF